MKNRLLNLSASYTWLVTGTPFDKIREQLEFMGHIRPYQRIQKKDPSTTTYGVDVRGNYNNSSQILTAMNAQKLRKILIHHSKAQHSARHEPNMNRTAASRQHSRAPPMSHVDAASRTPQSTARLRSSCPTSPGAPSSSTSAPTSGSCTT